MAKEQVGFKTSVFGFRKVDVLAYIDSMSAEHLSEQQKEQARAAALEETVSTLTEEKAVLSTALSEKKEQIAILHKALASQTEIAASAQQKADDLTQALQKAEASARDYQGRLFSREGEATILRRDNANLTRALSDKQQEIERIMAKAQVMQREASAELELVKESAQAELAQVRQRVDAQKEAAQQEMQQALEVQRKQFDTQKEATQQDMQQALESQRKQFDAEKAQACSEAVKKAALAQDACNQPAAKKSPCIVVTRRTSAQRISSLLTKFAKMIGES